MIQKKSVYIRIVPAIYLSLQMRGSISLTDLCLHFLPPSLPLIVRTHNVKVGRFHFYAPIGALVTISS